MTQRKSTDKSENWGGARPRSGPRRRRLQLTAKQAQSLYLLTKHRRALLNRPELTEEEVISGLVDAAWSEIEQDYEADAKVAEAPYIV